MSTSSKFSSIPPSSFGLGHRNTSSTSTTASVTSTMKCTSTAEYSLAFNLPPDIYALDTQRCMQLENSARNHYSLHANWLYSVRRQHRLAQDLEEAQRESDALATVLSQAALEFTKDLERARAELRGDAIPIWKEVAQAMKADGLTMASVPVQ